MSNRPLFYTPAGTLRTILQRVQREVAAEFKAERDRYAPLATPATQTSHSYDAANQDFLQTIARLNAPEGPRKMNSKEIARQNASIEHALDAQFGGPAARVPPAKPTQTRPFSPSELSSLSPEMQAQAKAGTLRALVSAPPANLAKGLAAGSVQSLSAHREQEHFDAQLRTELGILPEDETKARQIAAREQACEVRLVRNMLSGNCDGVDAQFLSAHPLERNTDQLLIPPEVVARIVKQTIGDSIEPKEVAATIGRVYQANAGQAFSVGAALASPLMALGITSANVETIVESIGDLQADLASKLPAITSALSIMMHERREERTDQMVMAAVASARNEGGK